MEAGTAYVRWEEVVVSNDKGRRVVHYYLRDAGGGAQLAVVGRERSVRHMSYAVPGCFLRSLQVKPPHLPTASPSSSSSLSPHDGVTLKWKTRREVIYWLSSLVSDSISYGSSPMMDRFSDGEDAKPTDIPTSKGISSGKMGHPSKEFSWLGSAWHCRKRRKHYRSFCRNEVTISVHDFVYVMAEDNKRLVAYVEDLFEDLRANNMVVVRWFHKVDEVGVVLPPDVNEREIFFSLCLQDFSVECIDGLAAVLSAQHFEKFKNEASQNTWEPYLCCRQIDNDDIKPFDITQVQGYWSQELLRSLLTSPRQIDNDIHLEPGTSSLKLRLKISCGGSSFDLNRNSRVIQIGPKKKHLLDSREDEVVGTDRGINKSKGLLYGSKAERHVQSATMSPRLLRKELLKKKLQRQQLALGSEVEVLSYDSGMRGCWFRCMILKRHHDKVKVRYEDVHDDDKMSNLEEWVLASMVAPLDKLGIRLHGRTIVRPRPSNGGTSSFNVGAVVDAWWQDGWWEGIVILREPEGEIHVYFPGEQRVSIFDRQNLRHSQDWVGHKWNAIKDRQDIANSLSASLGCKNQCLASDGCISLQALGSNRLPDADLQTESSPTEDKFPCRIMPKREPSNGSEGVVDGSEGGVDVPNLANDSQLNGLKWSSSRKRKRGRESTKGASGYKRQCDGSSSSSQDEVEDSNASGVFVLPKSLTVEQEICKIGGDPLFAAPMALCSSLVMSR